VAKYEIGFGPLNGPGESGGGLGNGPKTPVLPGGQIQFAPRPTPVTLTIPNLAITAIPFIGVHGYLEARATVTWDAPPAGESDVDVNQVKSYEIHHSTGTGYGPISGVVSRQVVISPLPVLKVLTVQVRARAGSGVLGPWSTASIVTPDTTDPPPVPTAPTITGTLRGGAAAWDGLFAGGAVRPDNFSYVEAQLSLAADFSNPVTPGRLHDAGQTAVAELGHAPFTVYGRLRARNTSGVYSAWSAAGTGGSIPIIPADVGDLAITTAKLADAAVNAGKVLDGAIGTLKLTDLSITTTKLSDLSVNVAKIVDGAIQSAKIFDGSVLTAKLADLSIITAKLADGAISASKVGFTVGGENLLTNSGFEDASLAGWAVLGTGTPSSSTTNKRSGARSLKFIVPASGGGNAGVQSGLRPVETGGKVSASGYFLRTAGAGVAQLAVQFFTAGGALVSTATPATIVADATAFKRTVLPAIPVPPTATQARWVAYYSSYVLGVDTLYLDDVQLEAGELVTAYAPMAAEITPGSITATEIGTDAVTSPKILAGAVVSGKVFAGSITATEIAGLTITAAKIAAHAITANEIFAGTITANEIATGTITGNKIYGGTITGDLIAGRTILASSLVAGTITSAEIYAGTITSDKIAGLTITGDKIAGNTIEGGKIAGNTITGANIQGGTITGDLITGSAITGKTLTGSTVSTGVSGENRVEMVASSALRDAIRWYNVFDGINAELRGTMGDIGATGLHINSDVEIGNLGSTIYQVGRRNIGNANTRVRAGRSSVTTPAGGSARVNFAPGFPSGAVPHVSAVCHASGATPTPLSISGVDSGGFSVSFAGVSGGAMVHVAATRDVEWYAEWFV
jgi:hypothetical protein